MDRRQQGSSPLPRNPRTGRPYRRIRDRVRLRPLCSLCEAKGLTVAGAEVDHIIRIRDGGAEHDPANLQHLCRPCHAEKTRREQQGGIKVLAGRGTDTHPPPSVHTRNQVRRQRQAWGAFVAELR